MDSEIDDLSIALGCFLDNMSGVRGDYVCIVVIQSTGAPSSPPRLGGGNIEWIVVPAAGASAARNVGLERALTCAGRVMFVDCRTLLSRQFCRAAFSKNAQQASLWCGNVSWSQIAGADHLPSPTRTLVDPVHIAYEGFLWRCVFHTEIVKNCRFREDIGPGTSSRIQSGEDCLFMRDVIFQNTLRGGVFDGGATIERLPRPDVSAKEQRYAYGAGYRVGQLLRTPFSLKQWGFLAQRSVTFLLRSLQLRLSLNHKRRIIGSDRLDGLMAGLRHRRKAGPAG